MGSEGILFEEFSLHYNKDNHGGKKLLFLGGCGTPGTPTAILWLKKETLLSCVWHGKHLTFNDMVEPWINLALKLPLFWTFCKIINIFYKLLVTGSTLPFSQEYHNWHTSQSSVVFSSWNVLSISWASLCPFKYTFHLSCPALCFERLTYIDYFCLLILPRRLITS